MDHYRPVNLSLVTKYLGLNFTTYYLAEAILYSSFHNRIIVYNQLLGVETKLSTDLDFKPRMRENSRHSKSCCLYDPFLPIRA